MAGKTGTIDSNEAVWFAGYTPEIAGVAMISIDNTKTPFIKTKKARAAGKFRSGGVKGYRVPSTGFYLQGSGSGDAGMKIWKPVMEKYFKQIPATSFKAPPKRIQVGKQVRGAQPERPEHLGGDEEAGKGRLHRGAALRVQQHRAPLLLHGLVAPRRARASRSSARSTPPTPTVATRRR